MLCFIHLFSNQIFFSMCCQLLAAEGGECLYHCSLSPFIPLKLPVRPWPSHFGGEEGFWLSVTDAPCLDLELIISISKLCFTTALLYYVFIKKFYSKVALGRKNQKRLKHRIKDFGNQNEWLDCWDLLQIAEVGDVSPVRDSNLAVEKTKYCET